MHRTVITINAGNLLETIAAVCCVYGVYRLAGEGWAWIAAFVILVALAEHVFPVSHWRLPLPRHPHPGNRLREHKQALQVRWYRLKAQWRASRSA